MKIEFDTQEMRGAADLLEAASEYLHSAERKLGVAASPPPSMPPSLGTAVLAGIDSITSRTRSLAGDLHLDAGTLIAVAHYVEAAQKEDHEIILDVTALKTFMSAVRTVNNYAKQYDLPEEAAARLLLMGVRDNMDQAVANLPRAARVAFWAGVALNAVKYWQESRDFDETAWRTVITTGGAVLAGKAGAAGGTALCVALTSPTGPAGATACGVAGVFAGAISGIFGGMAADHIGRELYSETTADEIMAMVESIERLPGPAQEMLRVYVEDGYSFVDALRTVELNYGMLDDPQIDE
jgi:hypothetical protein